MYCFFKIAKMNQRLTLSFVADDAPLSIFQSLAGFRRIPNPTVMSVSLLHLNLPFEMVTAKAGLLLVNIREHTPHRAVVNGVSYPYTWSIPFEPNSSSGNFAWFCQSQADERFDLKTTFMDSMWIDVTFVTKYSDSQFPTTTADRFGSLELLIRAH